MKNRHILIYSFIFFTCMVISVNATLLALTGRDLTQIGQFTRNPVTVYASSEKCTQKPPIANLQTAQDPYLTKLTEYQTVCGSFVADRMMLFTDMPKDMKEAAAMAKTMSITLKEFSAFHITPVVIIEPNSTWGLVSFSDFETGFYNPWIDRYFATLKTLGITDQQMGIWVPFPEANLPYWDRGNTTPADFALDVNDYLSLLKKYFPEAKGSVLLNSATYETSDINWANGEYSSLVPYVVKLKKGLVDSFGLQGFPWAPQATVTSRSITDATEFINSKLAIQAASTIGVKEIWFNTGTFSAKYTDDSKNIVEIAPDQRAEILHTILTEIQKPKAQGYTVWINLFSQNKSDLTEATNWSYWSDPTDTDNMNRVVFKDFVTQLNQTGIKLSIFDVKM